MESLWAALVGGIVGAVVAAVGSFWQSWVAAKVKVDEGLREKREKDYLALWQLTRILPLWPRADEVTYAQLEEASRALRDWYFDGGGLYLSTEARQAYGNVQKLLHTTITAATDLTAPLDPADYDRMQAGFSALRTELTRDLLSRERSALSIFDGRVSATR